MLRVIFCVALAFLIPLIAHADEAYSPPPGWIATPGQLGPTYRNPDNADQAIIVMDDLNIGSEPLTSVAQKLGLAFANVPGCRRLDNSQPTPNSNGSIAIHSRSDNKQCTAALGLSGERRARAVVTVAPDLYGAEASYFKTALAWAGVVETPAPPANTPAPETRQTISSNLSQAVADVPAAHRPLYVSIGSESSFLGFPPALTVKVYPIYVFQNGKATNCMALDPLTLDFAAAQRADEDCDVWRWRGSAPQIEIETEPGKWEPFETNIMLDFGPGERPGISFVNRGGAGSTNPGVAASGVLWGGGLVLDRNGRFEISDWSSSMFSGYSTRTIASASQRQQPLTGRYHLDGHIIILAPDEGAPFAAYIAGDDNPDAQGRLGHVYFGGTHYWNDQD